MSLLKVKASVKDTMETQNLIINTDFVSIINRSWKRISKIRRNKRN